jgi:ATP adenylyltransferase
VEGCLACDLYGGRVDLPGGVIHDSSRWVVEHTVGPLGVGTLIVKPRRHVVHVCTKAVVRCRSTSSSSFAAS